MNHKNLILDEKELEELCSLYMECRLSLFEEKELQYVLSKYKGDSPIIDDVKKIMEVETHSASFQYRKRNLRLKLNYTLKRLTGIAALLVLLCSFGIASWLIYKKDELNSRENYCEVYSNGELVADKQEALSIANKNIRLMEEFENKMDFFQAKEEEKVDKFNKITIQIP